MFPTDTKQVVLKTYDPTTSGTLLESATNERTILWITANCSEGNNEILNGGVVLTSLSGTNSRIETFSRYVMPANTSVTYTKTVGGNCFFRFLYVDYNLTLTSTTSPIVVVNTGGVSLTQGFTYGEVMIILILLLIFTQAFFSELKQWIFGVRIENPLKNKYNKDV